MDKTEERLCYKMLTKFIKYVIITQEVIYISLCNKCGKYEMNYKNECSVCSFKRRRKLDIEKVINNNFWNEEEIEIIIYNILYSKFDCINKIIPLLNNKNLNDLLKLITKDLTIRGQTSIKVEVSCDVCKSKYLINPSLYFNKKHYCSFECRNKGFIIFGSHKGENNSQYNSSVVKCTNCKKDILSPKYKRERKNSFGDNHIFCSQECYWEYRSKYYLKEKSISANREFTKEQRKMLSKRTTEMIVNGKFPQTFSSIHKTISDNINISHINEFNLKYQCLDIYFDKLNLGIEIMGDYWHGSPLKYSKDDLSKLQLKDIKQDKRKNTYTKKYYNFEILYLWEYDIKNNLDLCLKLINLYIKNNGILKDYNSFNYHFVNNDIELNKDIIYPYFITKYP